jgi:hypothetical protein
LTLRAITREIIQLVETQTGIPVRVMEDPKLQVLATVRMARAGGLPAHLITYKQAPGDVPDYQICFECGYILRLFDNPPEKRFDITDTSKGREQVEKMITAPGGLASKYRLGKTQIEQMQAQFLNGVIVHLRSIPVGLRVSEWLSAAYPDLEALEKEHVQKELNVNRQSMSNEVKDITPKKVFQAAQSISAAYAWYWSGIYGKPELFNLYRLNGFEKQGQKLMEIFEQIPDRPRHDQELIDAWGENLGISDWFTWVPYQPPTEA